MGACARKWTTNEAVGDFVSEVWRFCVVGLCGKSCLGEVVVFCLGWPRKDLAVNIISVADGVKVLAGGGRREGLWVEGDAEKVIGYALPLRWFLAGGRR